MQITLTHGIFVWPAGTILDVDHVIPHGGYGDDPHQYVVKHDGKDVTVPASAASEIAPAA